MFEFPRNTSNTRKQAVTFLPSINLKSGLRLRNTPLWSLDWDRKEYTPLKSGLRPQRIHPSVCSAHLSQRKMLYQIENKLILFIGRGMQEWCILHTHALTSSAWSLCRLGVAQLYLYMHFLFIQVVKDQTSCIKSGIGWYYL